MTREPASTEEWRNIARVPNLYFHILSWPDREQGWSEEEFYATGEAEWADFARRWREYGHEPAGRCVEIGCGVGRLTRALAGDFDRVLALDVSEDMLAGARRVVPANVELAQVDGSSIPLGDGEADAVFSAIVLQHLETFADVRAYLADSFRALRPGGTAMLNIAIELRSRGALERLRAELGIRRSRRGLSQGRVHQLVRWREYPFNRVLGALREIGFEGIEFRVFPVSTNGWLYQFWFATKPGPGPAESRSVGPSSSA